MCLNSHYRKQLVFSYDALDNAAQAYQKLLNKVRSLGNEENGEGTESYQEKFKQALSDDLNTSLAITVLYDVLKSDLTNSQKRFLVSSFDSVLSLNLLSAKEEKVDSSLEEYIQEKIEQRNQAKKERDYETADKIREELLSRGIIIKDTREGTVYEVK